jgi:hypothetical protein
MMIDWEKFAARATGIVARATRGYFGEFMFIDTTPFYAQEHALSPYDLHGRFLSEQQYKDSQEFHEKFTNMATRLRVEVLDQSTFHRMVDPTECEYLINDQWRTFDEVMA